MEAAEFHRHVGDRNICVNIEEALTRAEEIQAFAMATTDPGRRMAG